MYMSIDDNKNGHAVRYYVLVDVDEKRRRDAKEERLEHAASAVHGRCRS